MIDSSVRLMDLSQNDLQRNWLWIGVPAHPDGALRLKPTKVAKTDKFAGRLVSCQVRLADGTFLWALIEGINPEFPVFSKHNRELRVLVDGYGWFHLAQYFDSDALKAIRGNEVLCQLLKKKLKEVFPIQFDISTKAKTPSPCLSGEFEHEEPVRNFVCEA